MEWLTSQVREVHAMKVKTSQLPQLALPNNDVGAKYTDDRKDKIISWMFMVAGVVLTLAMLRSCAPACMSFGPHPVIVSSNAIPDRGVFSDGLQIYGIVRNNGRTGTIRAIARVTVGGVEVETQLSDIRIPSGQSAEVFFQMNKIEDLDRDYKWQFWTETP
ncbi:MAG: hypothetical protein HC794_08025 [Nitrospiraceae bacterium]|nr:hypothetical protein [Nitrospiraceae bacterium]